jgi:acyl-CoA synthetase (AMP-forming)/AMP-acid ligase II
MNTTDFLSIANAICPERDCIVFEGKRWTYSRITDRINQLAHALAKKGVEKEDRIGFLHVNCNQYIETYFAGAKLGAIFVPLNFRAKADELAYMIGHAEVKVCGREVSGPCEFNTSSNTHGEGVHFYRRRGTGAL